MNKVLRELLKLLWKAFRLVVWKWLGPMVKRFAFLGVIVVGLISLVIFLATKL